MIEQRKLALMPKVACALPQGSDVIKAELIDGICVLTIDRPEPHLGAGGIVPIQQSEVLSFFEGELPIVGKNEESGEPIYGTEPIPIPESSPECREIGVFTAEGVVFHVFWKPPQKDEA